MSKYERVQANYYPRCWPRDDMFGIKPFGYPEIIRWFAKIQMVSMIKEFKYYMPYSTDSIQFLRSFMVSNTRAYMDYFIGHFDGMPAKRIIDEYVFFDLEDNIKRLDIFRVEEEYKVNYKSNHDTAALVGEIYVEIGEELNIQSKEIITMFPISFIEYAVGATMFETESAGRDILAKFGTSVSIEYFEEDKKKYGDIIIA